MARIRTIKPDFWTSEQIMNLTPLARLMFIGMWNFCDYGGNHPASVRTIKALVFPEDDVSTPNVQGLIDDLLENELVIAYEVEGKVYWHVTGWHHQLIDQPTFKYPSPDGTTPAVVPRRRVRDVREPFEAMRFCGDSWASFRWWMPSRAASCCMAC
jgi:hypothetical protein